MNTFKLTKILDLARILNDYKSIHLNVNIFRQHSPISELAINISFKTSLICEPNIWLINLPYLDTSLAPFCPCSC